MTKARSLRFRGSLGAGGGGGSAPTVTGVSPSSGSTAGGTSVSITGTGFSGVTGVTIGGAAVTSYTVNSSTSITAVTASHSAGATDVVVATGAGTGTGTGLFTFAAPGAPTISSVSPSSGDPSGGASVTILGTNFTGATAVTFGGTNATSFTVNSATSITAVAPAHLAGSADVVVTTGSGSATDAAGFTYVSAGSPVLYRITSPEYSSANPAFEFEVADTVGAGATFELQLRTAGASNWSSLVRDVTHTMTSTEDTNNSLTMSFSALSSGNYEARGLVNGTATNTLTVTV